MQPPSQADDPTAKGEIVQFLTGKTVKPQQTKPVG